MSTDHRRRIKTEEKAKVVTSMGGGEEFIQFLAALAVLPRTILKNRMTSSFLSNHPGAIQHIIQNRPRQNSQRGKQKRRPLPFLLFLSFFYIRLRWWITLDCLCYMATLTFFWNNSEHSNGTDATVNKYRAFVYWYIYLAQKFGHIHTYTFYIYYVQYSTNVASALTMTGSVIMRRFRSFSGRCSLQAMVDRFPKKMNKLLK